MLSEACLEFLQGFANSARKIAAEAHLLIVLDDRPVLSEEIEALLCVSVQVAVDPCDLSNAFRLLSLVNQINKASHSTESYRPMEISII